MFSLWPFNSNLVTTSCAGLILTPRPVQSSEGLMHGLRVPYSSSLL